MIHRHLNYPPDTPAAKLPSAAIVDILERGDLATWAPIAAEIAANPRGEFADRVSHLIDAYPMYGTSRLWRAWIDRCRARPEGQVDTAMRLGDLRRAHGLTQAELGERIEMSQSDLSKLERRRDIKLSTLSSVAEALGYRLQVTFTATARAVEIVTDSQAKTAGLSGAYERAWVEAKASDWDVVSGDGLSPG